LSAPYGPENTVTSVIMAKTTTRQPIELESCSSPRRRLGKTCSLQSKTFFNFCFFGWRHHDGGKFCDFWWRHRLIQWANFAARNPTGF